MPDLWTSICARTAIYWPDIDEELGLAGHEAAAELGAAGLYVSATPSENTVGFYRRRGCQLTLHPDPELFALEPEDIHFECWARSA